MHAHCLVPYTQTTWTPHHLASSRTSQTHRARRPEDESIPLPFHQKRNKATGGQAAVSTVSTLESRTSLASDLWPPPPWPGKQRNAAEFAVISSARASLALTTERLQHHVIDWFQSSAFRQQRLQSPWLEHVGVSSSRWCALSDIGAGSQIPPTWQVSASENRKDWKKDEKNKWSEAEANRRVLEWYQELGAGVWRSVLVYQGVTALRPLTRTMLRR